MYYAVDFTACCAFPRSVLRMECLRYLLNFHSLFYMASSFLLSTLLFTQCVLSVITFAYAFVLKDEERKKLSLVFILLCSHLSVFLLYSLLLSGEDEDLCLWVEFCWALVCGVGISHCSHTGGHCG